MGKSVRLTNGELLEATRLTSDLRELRHDRPAMYARLIDGLTALVGGTCGFACDVADWRPAGNLRVNTMVPDSTSGGAVAEFVRGLAASGSLWEDPSFAEGVRRTGDVEVIPFHQLMPSDGHHRYPLITDVKRSLRHVDHLLAWHRIGRDRRDVRGISIHRWGAGHRRFGGRETELARIVFDELNWLDATGRLDPPVPGLGGLPPRLEEVLNHLRAGHAPKQIAVTLGLSVHTVRDHIKRIYARAEVRDRSELMALLGRDRRPPPPPPPPPPAGPALGA
jgi:DNA-binding CsgD family transcriptional regulator